VERLQSLIESTPEVVITVEVGSGRVTAGSLAFTAALPVAQRDAFVTGQWNPTAMLLENFEEVSAVGARLPYLTGF
jgi:hypothetical protein